MENVSKILSEKFPIPSQTSQQDKLFLLKAIKFIKSCNQKFNYIEIGSFLGGSLCPFLQEEICDLILSVDERGRQQPDERGAKYDYEGFTEQTMIRNLISHGLDVSKLKTHNGSISTYPDDGVKFDIGFIDGEHTDVACVRDFIWLHSKMKRDSLILFHDSTIIYKGLSIIREIMREKKIEFLMFKDKKSEMSAIFQGRLAAADCQSVFGDSEEFDDFMGRSEMAMLSATIRNRVKFNVNYDILPCPVYKPW